MHIKECQEATKAYESYVKEFREKHPYYCETCGGWGGFVSYYDPSPSGVALSPGYMMDFDPCPDCYEQGKCPMCAGELLFTDDEPQRCPHCNWDEEQPEGLEEPPGCLCPDLETIFD